VIRRVLLVGLILLLVLIGGDVAARAWAQSRVGDELRRSLDLSRKPDVSLGGFPFVWHAVEGSFPSARLRAEDVTARGVSFAEIDVTLVGIRFSPRQLAAGRATTIAARGGHGTASLGGPGLTRLLRDRGVPVTVQLSAGTVTLTSERVPGRASATVGLDGGRLLIRSAELGAAYAVELPELVPGIRFTSARVTGSIAVLGLALNRVRLRV
jgi:LmeA-like phospholipid-binding